MTSLTRPAPVRGEAAGAGRTITPKQVAASLGILRGFSTADWLTWDRVLDLAVVAYWRRRAEPLREAA
jgi:hypothetical protein